MLESKSRKGNYHLQLCISMPFVCLVPVRLLFSSMAVLYLMNGKLQRACNCMESPTKPRIKNKFGKGTNIKIPKKLGYVSGKLPTYPSPKPKFNTNSHLRQNVGLGEGWVGSFPETYNDPKTFIVAARGEGGYSLYGEAPPERGTLFRPQVYERVVISPVKEYERLAKTVISVCKKAQEG